MRNQSLAILAKSSITPLIVSIGLLAGSSAMADPVYKWKDANGQSHYSQQPPEGMKYDTITTAGSVSTPTPVHALEAGAPTTAPVTASPQAMAERKKNCEIARKNVDLLASHPNVEMDLRNEGKPVRLTTEQQTAQLAISKQQVAMLCSN